MFGYLRQSTASQTRSIGPFVDDTDFKTLENALTINNTDILLKKNGGASAAKNSGGATADGSGGMYHLTFDATDSNTVGEIMGSVKVAGALVVVFKFTVLEEAVYDALFAASAPGYVANAPVNVAQFGGSNGTFASGRPEVNTSHLSGTLQTARDIGASVLLSSGTGTGQLKLASGYVAMTWADIAAPTTTVNLSGTTVKTATDIATLIGTPASTVSADIASIQADIDAAPTAADIAAATIESGLVLSYGTIGSTGNDTTHLHLTGLTYGDDEINDQLIVIKDVSTGEYHARWISDWADTGDLATVATLPFTPESAVDQYWVSQIRKDALTAAQVNAEVLDVLNTDTFAEPGQEAPPATTTLVKKIGYLYKLIRNRITQTSTQTTVYADDAATVDHKATVSDDGTTFDRGELGSGP